MTSGEIALGIAGLASTLATAALGFYSTIRARTSPYRDRLYSTQVETITQLFEAISAAHAVAGAVITAETAEERRGFWVELQRHMNGPLARMLARSVAVMPEQVYRSANQFHAELTDLLVKSAQGTETTLDGLESASGQFFQAARHFLGVDSLSRESLELFGSSSGKAVKARFAVKR